MSVLAIFRWRGDSESLLAAVDKELEHPVARDRRHRQAHVRARADDGMVIVDLWDSEEDFRAMVDDPAFQKNLQDAGTPDADVLEVSRSTPPSPSGFGRAHRRMGCSPNWRRTDAWSGATSIS
jgi:hypothetical protein